MKCGLIEGECATNHEEHFWNVETQKVECKCKPNFNKDCTECLEGFELNDAGDCVYKEEECPEEWIGDQCDICPSQYKITIDEDDVQHCTQCADNRAQENNEGCMKCNEDAGFATDPLTGGCVKNGCTEHLPGYEEDENGYCVCSPNYFRDKYGFCQEKKPDLFGQYINVNNTTITLENDGVLRDVYGMKPVKFDESGKELKDESGNTLYYDTVYNGV